MQHILRFIYTALLFCPGLLWAQPFAQDILAFKQQDAVSPPPAHAILFIGSSSFTMWKDVQEYFPGRKILNRGFGGSTLQDVIRYESDIIFRYQPKQIVIYCGENDLALDTAVTADTVFLRFQRLFKDIREHLPGVQIGYVSMKPSPSRAHLMGKMEAGNRKIRKFLHRQPNAYFVNVYPLMLLPNGKPNSEIFLDDMLHMNAKGYDIWRAQLDKHLK